MNRSQELTESFAYVDSSKPIILCMSCHTDAHKPLWNHLKSKFFVIKLNIPIIEQATKRILQRLTAHSDAKPILDDKPIVNVACDRRSTIQECENRTQSKNAGNKISILLIYGNCLLFSLVVVRLFAGLWWLTNDCLLCHLISH